jgi:transcriptional regulator with XRE-family HTH domain
MEANSFLRILGDKIRAIRKTKKMSQEKLAEIAGLHPTYISDIENGKVNASIYSYFVVANALGIPFSELVNLPVDRIDRNIENGIAELLGSIRSLTRKRQVIFLSAAKGLLTGIEKVK